MFLESGLELFISHIWFLLLEIIWAWEGRAVCLFTNIAVILHYCNWSYSLLHRLDNVVFLFHHGTTVKWKVFGSKGDGCASGREITRQSGIHRVLVWVSYHSWSWEGVVSIPVPAKTLWNSQIWEGGSESLWEFGTMLLDSGNLHQRKCDRYLIKKAVQCWGRSQNNLQSVEHLCLLQCIHEKQLWHFTVNVSISFAIVWFLTKNKLLVKLLLSDAKNEPK